ncbi:glycoside hydrolase family 2 TIM barrel-domain containing protein [Pseudoxanthomonas putridarboris]|uniref:Glycoside hydrolase family 2 TIM barrel-domain containing protein n=1 Tax=Pseudoxanthomonas putridarboris TaxID=752605 RepID=A0ABU9J3G3_9GAMM
MIASAQHAKAGEGPAQVRIVQEEGRYRLLVDGQPFHVKGAGLANGDQEELAARGGNSFRTWSTGTDREEVLAMLDRARRNGLMVAMGITVGNERHGFDYDDADAVAEQLQRIRTEVELYKDHPAVLMWVAGNELNLEYSNPAVWDAVGRIADMIHQVDPNHPVMTTVAGFDAKLIDLLKTRAGSLDLIGIQLYGDIGELPGKLRASDWTGPYIVTEWGPTGHWESPLTTWQAPIEDDASRKAQLLQERYERVIAADTKQGLGSYVFLWGDKQERTPTWYGLFLPSGETTPAVDAMQYVWTGRWPDNRAPSIRPLRLDGRVALDSVTLRPGVSCEARADAEDSDGDALSYRWTVLRESTASTIGGDREDVPPQVPLRMDEDGKGGLRFTAPEAPGNYRLFVEVHDGKGHAAYANLPFRVEAR